MVEKVRVLNRLPISAEVSTVDRRQPIFKVLINGLDSAKVGFQLLIQEIDLEMIDEGLSRVDIFLSNDLVQFTDDLLFAEGANIQIFMGYASAGLVFMGQFILDTPRFDHRTNIAPRIVLQAFSEEVQLANEEKRRTFKDVTDSRVAEILAAENDLRPDVEQTSIKYPQIVQMNESDIKLLEKRAKLNGFQIYIEDSVLHFHKVRNITEDVTLNYRRGEKSHLFRFDAKVKRYKKAFSAELSQFDPLTGRFINIQASEVKDAITQSEEKELGQVRAAEEITGSPKKFIIGQGHLLNPEELEQVTRGHVESSRWVVSAMAESWGNPRVKPRRVINIEGVSKFDGQYYVKSVRHKIGRGYTMSMELRKTLTGQLSASKPIRARDSSSAGTRTPVRGVNQDFGRPNVVVGVFNTARRRFEAV